MTDQAQDTTVQALDRAISSGAIPAKLQEQAKAVLAGMTKPVRLTVFGLPGSGKSSLMNLLLGKEVFAHGDRLPTTQITWGDVPKSSCTMADGSTQELDHFDTAKIASTAPIFVQTQMPLPALGKISLMEVVANGSPAELARALAWASNKTDVALWCSQSFGQTEQQLWDAAPDKMKDHAFLLLTKADVLSASGSLNNTLSDVRDQSADQFKEILAIATLDAIAARGADGRIDKEKMTASGGRALIAAILHEVELGRQAAKDQAELLLNRYPPAEAASAAAPAQQADQPAQTDASPQDPVPQDPVPQDSAEPVTLHPATRAAYEDAVERLSQTGQRFAEDLANTGTVDATRLMDETVSSVQWLCDYLSENGEAGDPALIQMRNTAFDAADLMQLMQMENETTAVTESLSVVIQLKREMEAGLAA
ncbi:MAG: hypothetical protein WA784_11520 [Albidovulum sp.]